MMRPLSCDEVDRWLDAAIDDELSADERLAVVTHVAACARCTARERELRGVQRALRDGLPKLTASPALRERVRMHLREAAQSTALASQPRPSWVYRWRVHHVPALALAFVFGVGLMWWRGHGSETMPSVASQVVDSHIRSLMADHLTDVRSTDQHTVKPWFARKIDFAPRVEDFSAQGFPLVGGRLDYVAGHAAATLVYTRRAHVINLFIWPLPPNARMTDGHMSLKGYSVRSWHNDGMAYWAVSDAASGELVSLEALYQGVKTP
ncbi:MAG TPA: zf-HC2 domain-containing protein [Gemmatimonadaceae bacterium]|jgi:anti-sigma factor RsiW|nr:zf-HC2 domain-containing protein [Gemmatimonadaceae bacterium]